MSTIEKISVEISVVLGGQTMPIHQLLRMGRGAVIELDRQADEDVEILANDVRCTHAAAVAQIDKEQLFYLRSRGLDKASSTRLVIEGFMAELVERFEEGAVRDALAAALERRLATVLGD